jgi:hypothetical protein
MSSKPPCIYCDRVHTAMDAEVVGSRFDPNGPAGYRARNSLDAPLRATRDQAIDDACQQNSPTVWGRVQVHGRWRPAYTRGATMYAAPDYGPWRQAADAERTTWQQRRPEHQHTVGHINDDGHYLTGR